MKKLFVVLMLMPLMALAETEVVNGITWTYSVSAGKAQVGTGVSHSPAVSSSTRGAITIPSKLGGCPVTSIGDYAFYYCSGLTSVTIPSSVTSIGSDAFYDCSELTSVTIPLGVTSIGEGAFYDCSGLTSVMIPESVTSIGDYAFSKCRGLTLVTISEGVTNIGDWVFYNCSGLTSVTIPLSVTSIGDSAFCACSRLTSVTIPSGVTRIGEGVFDDCSGLTSVTISEGVTSIGDYAFKGCIGLTSVTIPEGVTSIGRSAFYNCSGLTSVTIPEGVTNIGDYAFYYCSGLTSMTIPSSVTRIDGCAFCACSGLMAFIVDPINTEYCAINGLLCSMDGKKLIAGVNGDVTIPSSVTSIGSYAFSGYRGLISVTIPSCVTRIENWAFDGCSQLTTVYVSAGDGYRVKGLYNWPDTVKFVEPRAPTNVSASDGTYSDRVSISWTESIGTTSYNLYRATTSTCPSTATKMDVMSPCDDKTAMPGVKYYYWVETVSSAGSAISTFDTGYRAMSLALGKMTDSYAAAGGSGSAAVTANTSWNASKDVGWITLATSRGNGNGTVTYTVATNNSSESRTGTITVTAGTGTSYPATPKTIVVTQEGVIKPAFTIVNGVLTRYTGTGGAVTIPSSVTRIGDRAFSGCSGLTSVTIPSSVTSIGDYAFYGCSGLTSVKISESVTSIGDSVFRYCSSLKSVKMPASVTIIDNYAFEYCSELTSVTIPSGVTSVGDYAFYGCAKLKQVFVASSIENLGVSSFPKGCSMIIQQRALIAIYGTKGQCKYTGQPVDWYSLSSEKSGAVASVVCEHAFLDAVGVGEYLSKISADWFQNTNEFFIVDFSVHNDANFKIIPRQVSLGTASQTKVYDGEPLRASDVTIGGDGFAGGECVAETRGSQTEVGFSKNTIALNWAIGASESNYSITINEGTLTVLPRPVTVTTESATKVYDGMPLTAAIESGGDGFVEGECTATASGSQTVVGSSKNTAILSWLNGASPLNYDLTITEGTLTVLPAKVGKDGMEPGAGVVAEGGLSKFDTTVAYNGFGHTIDTNALMGVTLVADTPMFSYSLTSNGVFRTEPYSFTNACVTSVWYKISATNYEDYVHEARVTILPREVTLTSGAAQKKYDGVALANDELNAGGDGFVGDDGVTWTCTGSQTEVGSSENTFEYAFKEGALASNYNVTKQYGTLTVEYAGVTSVPQISPSEFFGDSGEVTIDCEMADAVVHFTLDGTTPTEASAVYEGPFAIPAKNTATVVKAIAVRHGWMPSEVAEQRIISLTPPDGSGNAVTNAAAVCHADNAGVLDITYDVAGNSSSNRQKVEVVVSVCGTNLTYVVADGSVSDLGAAGRHTVTVDFSSVLNAAKGYSYIVKVGGSSVEVPNWAEGKEGLLVKDNWVYGHTDSTIRELEIPDGVVGIAAGAFAGFAQLETVSLPLTLRQICANAFTMATHLTSIVLPEGLEFIGDEAFYGCTKMANVIVPGSVKSVGRSAFRQCTALTNAQIAYGVESIGDECFYSDWRISEVDLPSTVTNIGKEAFGGDSSIIRAGLRCDVRKMSEIFSNYQHIREIIVKEGDGEIVDGCFKDCEELKDVRYMGNCPALEKEGRELYANTFVSNTLTLVSYVLPESTGWDGIESSDQLPQAWPLVGGYRRPIAHWDVPTYLCRFDSNGGTLGVQDTYQYSEQDVVLPPEPVQSGYKFAGWWTQPVGGLRVTERTIFIEGVYTYLWAHWVKGHTVFLDPNGGVVINGFVTYVEESVYGVLPMPVRSGYAFDGWLYNNEKIRPDTKINEMADHTLTAQWTANQYKVQYHPNGGTGELVVEEWVYGETNCLRRNAFVREGYVFIGWATEEGSDEVVYGDCEPVANLTTEDGAIVELWAVWQESDAVDPTNVELSFGGEANWEKVYELVSAQMDGHVVCTPSFWRSGKVADVTALK